MVQLSLVGEENLLVQKPPAVDDSTAEVSRNTRKIVLYLLFFSLSSSNYLLLASIGDMMPS